MSDDPLRAARRDLLDIMRRMDCQDLFDDAFYALVRYERVALAAAATDEGRCLHCHESASGVCTLHNGSAALAREARSD